MSKSLPCSYRELGVSLNYEVDHRAPNTDRHLGYFLLRLFILAAVAISTIRRRLGTTSGGGLFSGCNRFRRLFREY